MTALASTRTKLESIQGARGIAALLVVLYHLTVRIQEIFAAEFAWGLFRFGWMGVDFFFVLSGFIILHVHQVDLGVRSRLRPYLEKRFTRIYPLYFLVTVVALAIYLTGYGEAYKRTWPVIAKSFLLLPQSARDIYPLVNVGWTLSFEALFYLVFAAFIMSGRQVAAWLVVGWTAAIVARLIAMVFGVAALPRYLEFLVDWHNLEFLLGCLCAILVQRTWSARVGAPVLGLGLMWLVGSAFVENYGGFRLHPLLAFGIPCFLTVWGLASLDRYRPSVTPGILVRLGDASYSLYLIHFIALSFALIASRKVLAMVGGPASLAGWPANLLGFAIASACVGLAFLVHERVEKPSMAAVRDWFGRRAPTEGKG